ncbi:alpha/beta hydrolase [Neisseria animalis]|nr:alpha/beta hydrolase [Neisseria animalis]VEE06058.1 Uncharacterized conserved protein [Neisseria animalis]
MKKILKMTALAAALAFSTTALANIEVTPMKNVQTVTVSQEWDKTFAKSDKVEHQKVQFRNRFGNTVVGDLYMPKNAKGKLPAIVVSGPFGAVKEQSSGLHAQTLAERGFVTLAFDPSFTGESGGAVRDVASPEMFTEDFSAAVDFLGLQAFVNREKIGVLGVCGLSGMAISATSVDSRIKAVATTAMYDMSRSMSKGYEDYYTPEQQQKIIKHISEQRWKDAENGNFALGWHELGFDENGNVATGTEVLPKTLEANAPEMLKRFHDYYRGRAYHKNAINSNSAWTATTPYSFFAFPLMANTDLLGDKPVLLVTGTNAHSRYYSEDVYKQLRTPNKELLIVNGADHVDLYDNLNKIPFDKFEAFFKANLK